VPELLAIQPDIVFEPRVVPPASRTSRAWTREDALVEIIRGRMSLLGPTTAQALAEGCGLVQGDVDPALLVLESEGALLRGTFTPGSRLLEWCDRRLLARIHRYTLNRLRAEIAPVSPAEFMRFLFGWQHMEASSRLSGVEGVRAILAQLDGLELPARAWERDVLPARVERYESSMLDVLCLSGEIGWARLSSGPTQMVGATPIALFAREHAEAWVRLKPDATYATTPATETEPDATQAASPLSNDARRVLERLEAYGASFAHELRSSCDLTQGRCRDALGELVAAGLVASDGFAGVRTIIGQTNRGGTDTSGRWSVLRRTSNAAPEDAVRALAWTLLARYGVVFRRVLTRESSGVPWRDLARVYRTLEARGEIRGGRFVSGMSGEQFALPDAVDRLRERRRSGADGSLMTISAADPLNLTGIITGAERIRTAAGNRIVYRNGIPVAAMEGDMLRTFGEIDPSIAADVAAAAAGRPVPVFSGFVGRLG
jgi:ATP-dependent Lhr-like helicase